MNADNAFNHISTSDDHKTALLPVRDPIQRSSSSSHSLSLSALLTPNNFYILSGPILCAIICLLVKLDDAPVSSRNMLAILAWMFSWWLTEAVPMPITSMSPLFLFPLFGIASADSVAKSYMDDVISLVLGSFILVLAVEHYNIHRRLALNVSSWFFFFSHVNTILNSSYLLSILFVKKIENEIWSLNLFFILTISVYSVFDL